LKGFSGALLVLARRLFFWCAPVVGASFFVLGASRAGCARWVRGSFFFWRASCAVRVVCLGAAFFFRARLPAAGAVLRRVVRAAGAARALPCASRVLAAILRFRFFFSRVVRRAARRPVVFSLRFSAFVFLRRARAFFFLLRARRWRASFLCWRAARALVFFAGGRARVFWVGFFRARVFGRPVVGLVPSWCCCGVGLFLGWVFRARVLGAPSSALCLLFVGLFLGVSFWLGFSARVLGAPSSALCLLFVGFFLGVSFWVVFLGWFFLGWFFWLGWVLAFGFGFGLGVLGWFWCSRFLRLPFSFSGALLVLARRLFFWCAPVVGASFFVLGASRAGCARWVRGSFFFWRASCAVRVVCLGAAFFFRARLPAAGAVLRRVVRAAGAARALPCASRVLAAILRFRVFFSRVVRRAARRPVVFSLRFSAFVFLRRARVFFFLLRARRLRVSFLCWRAAGALAFFAGGRARVFRVGFFRARVFGRPVVGLVPSWCCCGAGLFWLGLGAPSSALCLLFFGLFFGCFWCVGLAISIGYF
jgi:hypothetical protein